MRRVLTFLAGHEQVAWYLLTRAALLAVASASALSSPADALDRWEAPWNVEIAAHGYDLSLNRYQAVEHAEVNHRAAREILVELAELEADIQQGLRELEASLA